MARFEHVRHKEPMPLASQRPLVIACPQFRSRVNLSRIVRVAGCCGVTRIVTCGRAKLDPEIARDAAKAVQLEVHRTLPAPLRKLKADGYQLVGLEQTTGSQCLYDFGFVRQTVLVLGSEREGLTPEILAMLDAVAEIPVFGLPYSYNVATAATMALYEYCRQFPRG